MESNEWIQLCSLGISRGMNIPPYQKATTDENCAIWRERNQRENRKSTSTAHRIARDMKVFVNIENGLVLSHRLPLWYQRVWNCWWGWQDRWQIVESDWGSSEVEGDCHFRDYKILNLTWRSSFLSPSTSIKTTSRGASGTKRDVGAGSRLLLSNRTSTLTLLLSPTFNIDT